MSIPFCLFIMTLTLSIIGTILLSFSKFKNPILKSRLKLYIIYSVPLLLLAYDVHWILNFNTSDEIFFKNFTIIGFALLIIALICPIVLVIDLIKNLKKEYKPTKCNLFIFIILILLQLSYLVSAYLIVLPAFKDGVLIYIPQIMRVYIYYSLYILLEIKIRYKNKKDLD